MLVCEAHSMLRDELTLKWMIEKCLFFVLDTPENVDSEKLNL
jgi:hypothetical protein